MNERIVVKAAQELVEVRAYEERQSTQNENNSSKFDTSEFVRFPQYCLRLLRNIPGNCRCIDCDESNPQWATISYGALICIECSGRHRHMGVETSTVRSLTMDSWKHAEVLAMLEGGNKQLEDFFQRHRLKSSDVDTYRTNAAKFYKRNLVAHVSKVGRSGQYKGRENYRSSSSSSTSSSPHCQPREIHQNKSSANIHERKQIIC